MLRRAKALQFAKTRQLNIHDKIEKWEKCIPLKEDQGSQVKNRKPSSRGEEDGKRGRIDRLKKTIGSGFRGKLKGIEKRLRELLRKGQQTPHDMGRAKEQVRPNLRS